MGARFRILILEDDDDLRGIFATVLAESGFATVEAARVDEALAALASRDVSLALVDFRPELQVEGVLWAQLERVIRAAAPAKVGLVAGWKLDRVEVHRRGFAFLLQIPCDIATLMATVSEHVGAREPSADEVATIHAYFDALSRKDWDALGALCVDGVVYNVPGSDPTFSQTVIGRDAFKRFSAETFERFPDAKFTVTAVLGLPTAVVARWTSRWTAPGGEPSTEGAIWFRFAHDKIASIGVRLDLQDLWIALTK